MGILQKEIDAFNDQIKARALIILIEWAGSQNKLAQKLRVTRYAIGKAIERGNGLSAAFAWTLAQMPGCPLTAAEIRPDVKDWDKYKRILNPLSCQHCRRLVGAPSVRTGTLRLIKEALKAAKNPPPTPLDSLPNSKLNGAAHKTKRGRKPRTTPPPPFVSL